VRARRTVNDIFAARELSVAADPGRLHFVREWAADAAREYGMGETDVHSVKLAVSEAVSNAVQHGSASPADSVRITISDRDGALAFEVLDSGRFRPPGRAPQEGDEFGRGLEIVSMVMDCVRMDRGVCGTTLRFAKFR